MSNLKKAVFENMDALIENDADREFCFNEGALEVLHDMHEATEFLFDLYKDEAIEYINEWRKLNSEASK